MFRNLLYMETKICYMFNDPPNNKHSWNLFNIILFIISFLGIFEIWIKIVNCKLH